MKICDPEWEVLRVPGWVGVAPNKLDEKFVEGGRRASGRMVLPQGGQLPTSQRLGGYAPQACAEIPVSFFRSCRCQVKSFKVAVD